MHCYLGTETFSFEIHKWNINAFEMVIKRCIRYHIYARPPSSPSVIRIRSLSDRIRIQDPDLSKFCESISFEYSVIIWYTYRILGKRACRTWFYPVKSIFELLGWFCVDHIRILTKDRYENEIVDPGCVKAGSGSQPVKIPGSYRIRNTARSNLFSPNVRQRMLTILYNLS